MTTILFVLAALVQEQVDNPEYKSWAGFKPGSTVTYKVTGGGGVGAGEQKTTLKSVGETEIVLAIEFSMNGKVLKSNDRQVPAKVPADKAPKEIKKGEEEIEVAGKKMKCVTMEFETKTANDKVFNMKIWANDEIPGKSAKVEVSSDAFKSSMVATAWEKK